MCLNYLPFFGLTGVDAVDISDGPLLLCASTDVRCEPPLLLQLDRQKSPQTLQPVESKFTLYQPLSFSRSCVALCVGPRPLVVWCDLMQLVVWCSSETVKLC